MQSIGTGISNLLQDLDPDTAKLFRIAQNNTRFKSAVRRTWSDNPDAAEYLLAHTNSIYFDQDNAPRIGPGKDEKLFMMGVYLDDSMARAELNARREKLQLAAAQEGLHVDSIRILPAQMGMKDRHLFPESVAYVDSLFGFAPRCTTAERSDGNDRKLLAQDQSNLLEILKRAFCRSFDDYEKAWTVLEKIEGASLDEVYSSKREKRGYTAYWCNLHVAECNLAAMEAVVETYGSTIMSSAKALRLYIRDINVRPSPDALCGEHAFPRIGAPIPLVSYNLHEPPTESARVAEEIRAKVNEGRKPLS